VLGGKAAQLVGPDGGPQGDAVQENDRLSTASLDEVDTAAVRGADHPMLDVSRKPQLPRRRSRHGAPSIPAKHGLADREPGPGGKGGSRSPESRYLSQSSPSCHGSRHLPRYPGNPGEMTTRGTRDPIPHSTS
jgi:hypothetical protein